MSYGRIKKLLSNEYKNFDDIVLIESPFMESTRKGKHLRLMHLALTPSKVLIASASTRGNASEPNCHICNMKSERSMELCSLYPLDCITLKVLKKIQRHSLKVSFSDGTARYFELSTKKNKTIFWNLWCNHIHELNSQFKLWPYSESRHKKWTNKYLYLGSKREREDIDRPTPIPGLGNTNEMKLSYLIQTKSICFDKSSQRIMQDRSDLEMKDYVYTYTGEAISNVAYTSIMTTVLILFTVIFSRTFSAKEINHRIYD